MKTLILVLLVLNTLVPLGIVLRSCVNRRGVEFDHLLMFTVGFLFYWILPIAVGMSQLFNTESAMRLWYHVFDIIAPSTLALYLVVSLCCYLSFAGGSALGRRWFRRTSPNYRPVFFYPGLLHAILALGLLLAALYAWALRGELFHGYSVWMTETSQTNSADLRGTFIAVSVFLLSLAFVYTTRRDEQTGFTLPFSKLIRNPFFVSYFVVAILVLSLGGRLYFVSGLIMLLVYRSVYFGRIPPKAAFGTLALVGVASSLVGLLRLKAALSAGGALLNVFIESLFTGFSLIHFLGTGVFEWVKFPIFLLSSFIDLVPRVLLPNKTELIVQPEAYGYVAFAPGGALNSYFSFMINFGILGTMVFFFCFACALQYLKQRDRRLLYRVVYVMLCGWIGFTFFRDPFFISLVKTMFQFSILTPVVLVLGTQIVSVALRNVLKGRPASPAPDGGQVPSEFRV